MTDLKDVEVPVSGLFDDTEVVEVTEGSTSGETTEVPEPELKQGATVITPKQRIKSATRCHKDLIAEDGEM